MLLENSIETTAPPAAIIASPSEELEPRGVEPTVKNATGTAIVEGDAPISKNAMKRMAKYERMKSFKESRKANRKAGRILDKETRAALRNEVANSVVEGYMDDDGKPDVNNTITALNMRTSKRQKRVPLLQKTAPISIIIDASFADKMNAGELNSMCAQVTRCYAANRVSTTPVHMHVTSFKDATARQFEHITPSYVNWSNTAGLGVTFHPQNVVDIDPILLLPPNDTDNTSSTLAETPTGKLVYLTADSENIITSLEPGTSYIIGGIVDKNRYKRLCLGIAEQNGMAHGKLPISEFVEMKTRSVLAINHETKDWAHAFEAIPTRKDRSMKKKKKECGTEVGDNDDEGNESSGDRISSSPLHTIVTQADPIEKPV